MSPDIGSGAVTEVGQSAFLSPFGAQGKDLAPVTDIIEEALEMGKKR